MSLPVIGINYDERAFYDSNKSSAETYGGVYVIEGSFFNTTTKVFNTGDPVADLQAARDYITERYGQNNGYLSSTFDFFPVHSCGEYRHVINAAGYRDLMRVQSHARV